MSVDERLRDGLGPLGVIEDGALERVVGDVVVRGRRRRAVRRAATGVLSVAILAAGLVVLPRLSGFLSSERTAQPATTESAVQDIAGTYRLDPSMGSSEAGVPRDLIGTWVVTFNPNGSVFIVVPPHFLERWDPPPEGRYRVDGNELRIDAFRGPGLCRGVGAATYSWSLSVDASLPRLDGNQIGLTLTPIDDSCEARRLLFTADVWFRH